MNLTRIVFDIAYTADRRTLTGLANAATRAHHAGLNLGTSAQAIAAERMQYMAECLVRDMPDEDRQALETTIRQEAQTEALEEAARVLEEFPGFLAGTEEGDAWIERKQSALRWITAGRK